MNDEGRHHWIAAKELKEQLSKIPDDAAVTFIADNVMFEFLDVGADTRPGIEGVFAINLRSRHNYPPISP